MRLTTAPAQSVDPRHRPQSATPDRAGRRLAVALVVILASGCWGESEPEGLADAEAAAAARDLALAPSDVPAAESAAMKVAQRVPDSISQPPSLMVQEPSAAASEPPSTQPPATQPAAPRGEAVSVLRSPQDDDAMPEDSQASDSPAPLDAPAAISSKRLELAADLPPQRLIDFLRSVDLEMQNVATGRKQMFDVDEANAELTRLAKLKLRAAERLETQVADEPRQLAVAIRGKLQALSHLAALGDLSAANQLERAAQEHVDSVDPSVALDSQLVLIGLAMERLQNGASSDPDEILQRVEQIASGAQAPDVAALMVMGQARAVLQQYGYDQAAGQVRATIVELFANHPNPNVSAMAVQIVGAQQFAEVDALLSGFTRGEEVSVQSWNEAVESLLSQSADLAAVQYLASAALQFEAFGNDELAEATYEILSQWESFGQAERAEIKTAAEARERRAAMIGQEVSLDLPSVDGSPLSLDDYRGRVVLMPFWAIAFPDSLTVLQSLDQIRQQFEGRVEIVGMNLDKPDAPADEFLQQSPVSFRSFQSAAPAEGGANELAMQFGVASMPFVVIIDPEGKVAAINLTDQGIREQVEDLLLP